MKYRKQIAAANIFLEQFREEMDELSYQQQKELKENGKISPELEQKLLDFKAKIQKANKMRTV